MLGSILHEKKLCSNHLSIISRRLFDNIVNIRKTCLKKQIRFCLACILLAESLYKSVYRPSFENTDHAKSIIVQSPAVIR